MFYTDFIKLYPTLRFQIQRKEAIARRASLKIGDFDYFSKFLVTSLHDTLNLITELMLKMKAMPHYIFYSDC